MSPTVLPTVTRPGGIQGRHVLWTFIAFFGTIFAVNGVLLYKALSTHSGVVANEPYRKGLTYNARIAADERQAALGWSVALDTSLDGRLSVTLGDGEGHPLRGLEVNGTIGRPSSSRSDLRLHLIEEAPGRYVARAGTIEPGAWQVDIEARSASHDAEPVYRMRRRLWLKP